MNMKKNESAKIGGNNIFINKEKFEKSKYKILVVLCHYNTDKDNCKEILDQINSNISEELNENDIAIYGFISDYEQKEDEKNNSEVKPDSKILEEIKGEKRKMYTKQLKDFVLDQSPQRIIFFGTSFSRIIDRRVEYNNQKIAFTKFLDEVGIRYKLLRRDGKEDDNAEKYEIKYILYGLDVELKRIRKHLFSKEQRKKLDGLYEMYMDGKRKNAPDMEFFAYLHCNSGLGISEDCFKGFRAYKRATYLTGNLLERMEKKAPEDDVDILNEILLKIEQAECFVPVSMLIEMVGKAKINFEKATNVLEYYLEFFSGKKNRIHSYNEKFQNGHKNIVELDSKCNRILNKLYKRLLEDEENDSTDACKIITERIFHACRKDVLKIYQERNYPSLFSEINGVKNVLLIKNEEREMIINNLWTPPKNAKQKK